MSFYVHVYQYMHVCMYVLKICEHSNGRMSRTFVLVMRNIEQPNLKLKLVILHVDQLNADICSKIGTMSLKRNFGSFF